MAHLGAFASKHNSHVPCSFLVRFSNSSFQIMRNTLYKAYLDDFASFCENLGGTTSEVMSDLLAFEADRRALNITLNRCVSYTNPRT